MLTADEKKCAQLRTLGTPVQKPSYFLSIQYGHEYGHEHELGHGHGHRHGHGRVVHGSDGPADRVGSGHDFAGFWRVGSGQHFGFISFLLIISWYMNRYESSNTTFGLIDFHRYLIYNNYLINK